MIETQLVINGSMQSLTEPFFRRIAQPALLILLVVALTGCIFPQNYNTPGSQPYPGTTSPQGYPKPTTPQPYPGTTSPQGYPKPTTPQPYPGTTSPQEYPRATNPPTYPGTTSSQGYPRATNSPTYPGATSQQKPASPNAQFLNRWAAETRASLPPTVDIFNITNIFSRCPSGCEANFPDTYLAIEARMPRHTKRNMPYKQVVTRVKSVFSADYCKSDGKDKNVIIRFIVKDMNGVLVANTLVEPADCRSNVVNNPIPRKPQKPKSHKYDAIAWYKLTSNANDTSGKSNAISLKGVQFKNGALYSDGVYQQSTASAYPKNWDLTRFSISAKFYVNDITKSRPVFITGHRWLGYYLDKNGTISMKYNNSNMVTSNTRYKINTWHSANITYENGIAYFFLDDVQIGYKKINFNFVNKNPTPSIGITDYSNGATFKGWIKDLIVYR